MPTIKHRRGTAAEWTAANPILADGELGFETDTGKFKLGDGLLFWATLPYFIDEPDTDAKFTYHKAEGDPHPQYETSAEAAAKITAHEAAGDPHPQYETSAEAAAKITAHEAAGDPHTQYATSTELTNGLALKAPLASPALTGSPTVPTPAAGNESTLIANTVWAAERARVGNLFTANQASVETDTTGWVSGSGAPTLARSTAQFFHGGASLGITATTTGITIRANTVNNGTPASTLASNPYPVTAGQVYTVSAMLRDTMSGRFGTVCITWCSANGTGLSTTIFTTAALVADTWTLAQGTAVAPATAAWAYIRVGTDGGAAPSIGTVLYADAVGFWAGAGGDWAMPGTPITNLGTKVSHPNVDDVLVQRWDSSKATPGWQTVHYDSGWRDISSLLVNGWTGTLWVRRMGPTVRYKTSYSGINATAATAGSFIATAGLPVGFRITGSSAPYGHEYAPLAITITGPVVAPLYVYQNGIARMDNGFGASNKNTRFDFTADCADAAIPTSLPGTLVSAAPA